VLSIKTKRPIKNEKEKRSLKRRAPFSCLITMRSNFSILSSYDNNKSLLNLTTGKVKYEQDRPMPQTTKLENSKANTSISTSPTFASAISSTSSASLNLVSDYTTAKKELTKYYRFKDYNLYKEYLIYNLNTKAYLFLFILILIYSCIFLPIKLIYMIYFPPKMLPIFQAVNIGIFLSCFLISVTGWNYIWKKSNYEFDLTIKFKKIKKFIFRKCNTCFNFIRFNCLVVFFCKYNQQYYLKYQQYQRKCIQHKLYLNSGGKEKEEEESIGNKSYSHNNRSGQTSENRFTFYARNGYSMKVETTTTTTNESIKSIKKLLSYQDAIIQHLLVFGIIVFNLLNIINYSMGTSCTDFHSIILNNQLNNCHLSIVGDRTKNYIYVLVVSPVIIAFIFKECLFEFHIINHLLTCCIALVFAWRFQWSNLCILGFVGWAIGGIIFLIDVHIQNVSSFINNYELKRMLLEKEKSQEKNNALEMRSMIGNVAHDLKTVRFLFFVGYFLDFLHRFFFFLFLSSFLSSLSRLFVFRLHSR
jgi:hypothetical protein